MRFRLIFYDTAATSKYDALDRHEFLGDREAIFKLWFYLVKILGRPYVEVYNLAGVKCDPQLGISHLSDYNI